MAMSDEAYLKMATAGYEARLTVVEKYERLLAEARQQSGLELVDAVMVHEVIDRMGIEPVRRFYSGTLADGRRLRVEEELKPFEGVRQPDKFWDNPKTGERCYFMRYEFRCWSIPTDYKPVPPDVLLARRQVREEKKAQKAEQAYREAFPLLVLEGVSNG